MSTFATSSAIAWSTAVKNSLRLSEPAAQFGSGQVSRERAAAAQHPPLPSRSIILKSVSISVALLQSFSFDSSLYTCDGRGSAWVGESAARQRYRRRQGWRRHDARLGVVPLRRRVAGPDT